MYHGFEDESMSYARFQLCSVQGLSPKTCKGAGFFPLSHLLFGLPLLRLRSVFSPGSSPFSWFVSSFAQGNCQINDGKCNTSENTFTSEKELCCSSLESSLYMRPVVLCILLLFKTKRTLPSKWYSTFVLQWKQGNWFGKLDMTWRNS